MNRSNRDTAMANSMGSVMLNWSSLLAKQAKKKHRRRLKEEEAERRRRDEQEDRKEREIREGECYVRGTFCYSNYAIKRPFDKLCFYPNLAAE